MAEAQAGCRPNTLPHVKWQVSCQSQDTELDTGPGAEILDARLLAATAASGRPSRAAWAVSPQPNPKPPVGRPLVSPPECLAVFLLPWWPFGRGCATPSPPAPACRPRLPGRTPHFAIFVRNRNSATIALSDFPQARVNKQDGVECTLPFLGELPAALLMPLLAPS